jgi:hypothetical protein
VSRSVEVADRVTVKTLPSTAGSALAQPLARVNAPTPRNVAVFLLSLLPWPTGIAIAVALLTQRIDLRIWPALAVGWSAVEFAIRNPHRVILERQSADSTGRRAYDLDVRSWWSVLIRSGGRTIALGPDSRLVRNAGVIDCLTGKLVELRIYRWQFTQLVQAFERAGFEVHDECGPSPTPWLARTPVLRMSLAAIAAVAAVAAVAAAVLEIHGL